MASRCGRNKGWHVLYEYTQGGKWQRDLTALTSQDHKRVTSHVWKAALCMVRAQYKNFWALTISG